MRSFIQKHIHNWLVNCLMVVVTSVGLSIPLVAQVHAITGMPLHSFAAVEQSSEKEDARIKDLQKQGDDCPQGACIITDYVNPAIKALAFVTGVFVVLSVVLGGIQYSISTDDAQKVSAAKDRITKAIIAFLMFLLLYAFLDYIVPGGVSQQTGK